MVEQPPQDKAAFATCRFPDPHAPGRMDAALGGFIATSYDKPNLNLPPENVARMAQAFRRFRWRTPAP
ncbi:MAG TPA: hypothetical protein P5137_11650 [Candidatus Brocadiia bacterium]|nr:hypothetical protein [Candidatus Brocadiia bacterium]